MNTELKIATALSTLAISYNLRSAFENMGIRHDEELKLSFTIIHLRPVYDMIKSSGEDYFDICKEVTKSIAEESLVTFDEEKFESIFNSSFESPSTGTIYLDGEGNRIPNLTLV